MILAVLQARMGSSRLPGKVMMPILGEPMIFRQIERLGRCKQIEKLVVATSTDPADDPLASACATRGVDVARGSLHDVLARFLAAARPYQPEAVVRLTGDCPLADPAVIDAVVTLYRAGGCDYASNVEPPTFPDGLDVEVIRFSALERADREAVLPSQREHVTPFVRDNKNDFVHRNYASDIDYSGLRWTVDEPADFAFVRAVYERLYPRNPAFLMDDILQLVKREPSLGQVNAGILRDEGYLNSLAADEAYKLTKG